jgi:hypothetical protein
MSEETMEANGHALPLDGNAAAGLLSEIFVAEPTTARATCASCGDSGEVGALMLYAAEMGAVLRCTACDAIVLRAVRTPTAVWLDARGAQCIVIAVPTRA